MRKAWIQTELKLKQFKWTDGMQLLCYHTTSYWWWHCPRMEKHRDSIVLTESFQYVCHLAHGAHLLQSNYGKLMLPTSLGIRVWGGEQCVVMNSNSIVFHGFPSPNKENVLRITSLSTWSQNSSKHEQITDPDRHQWIGLYCVAVPYFLYLMFYISNFM